MSELLSASFRFPTVVFTVAVVVAAVYWLVTVVGGLDAGSEGLDGDGIDTGGADGDGLLDVLGFSTVPPAVAASLVAVFSWFFSVTIDVAFHPSGGSGAIAVFAIVVALIVAFVVGTLVASVVARPLARFYASPPPNELADFVGRTCVIRTGRVDTTFGQAEVADHEGATLLIEVRCADADLLHRGDEALIFDFDPASGCFEVTAAPAMS